MSTAVATPNKAGTVRQMIEGYKDQFARALPKHLSPDRFVRCILTAITRTPKLADCDQASLFSALLTLSQLGIEPDGRRAHLIPFENRKRGCVECQLILDYKGVAELVMRSGIVSNLHADVVCENDVFEYDRGELKAHKIDFRKPRGAVYAVYALCRFKDGGEKCDVMTAEEVEAIRARSKAGNNGPWVTDWNEMSKKTVFKRLAKWLPISAEFRDAMEAEDAGEAPRASGVTVTSTVAPPAMNITMPDFSQPPTPPPTPEQIDDAKAEVEAGLAPVPKADQPDEQSPQERLAQLVLKAGFNFNHLQKWGADTGNIDNADSLAGFDDIPEETATRLFRATKGLLAGLAQVKGAA